MRITCPSCRAVYDVPDHLLAPGRTVRCAACAHAWAPVAESVAASGLEAEAAASAAAPGTLREAEPPPAAVVRPLTAPAPLRSAEQAPEWRMPEPAASSRAPELVVPPRTPAAEPEEPQNGSGAWIGWLATLAVLVLLAWAAYTWRAEVMQAWPPSQRAYATLGLAPANAPSPSVHPAPASPAPPAAPPQPAAPQPANPQSPAPPSNPAAPAQAQ